MPHLCAPATAALRRVELIVVLQQFGGSFFNTALQMVVKDRSVNATYPDDSLTREHSRQRAMADFYMTYNLISQSAPILPALLLAMLADRGWRRAPVVVPLSGYLLFRLALLLVVIYRLPLELIFAAEVVYGLSGGFCAYWSGVMTLASLSSTATDRSQVMMKMDLLYGTAGLVGSLVSGHLFLMSSSSLGGGAVLLTVSTLLHLLCLLLSMFLLQVQHVSTKEPEYGRCPPDDVSVEAPAGRNRVNVVLLFVAAMLYSSAVGGATEILCVFVLNEPLSWNAMQVGYGNAAGCVIYLTSFLGVVVFRCCVSDVMLILIGMLSFALGIFFMSIVTTTYMFYLARSLSLFCLIPMTTIRSLLSQQVPASSCGTILTSLQLSLKLAGLAQVPAFTKVYQRTLDWFPGFIFTLSGIITVLGMIPISIVGCRSRERRPHKRVPVE